MITTLSLNRQETIDGKGDRVRAAEEKEDGERGAAVGAGPTGKTWVEAAAAASRTCTGVRVRAAAAAETVKKLENTKVEAGAAGREANIVAREEAEEEVHGEAGGGAAVKTGVEAPGGAVTVKVRRVKTNHHP